MRELTESEIKRRKVTGWCVIGFFCIAAVVGAASSPNTQANTTPTSSANIRSVSLQEPHTSGGRFVTFSNSNAPALMKEFVVHPFKCFANRPTEDLDPDRICKIKMSDAVNLAIADRDDRFTFLMLSINGYAANAAGDGGVALDMMSRKIAETVEGDPQKVPNSTKAIKDKFVEGLSIGAGQIVRIKDYQIMTGLDDGVLMVQVRRY